MFFTIGILLCTLSTVYADFSDWIVDTRGDTVVVKSFNDNNEHSTLWEAIIADTVNRPDFTG